MARLRSVSMLLAPLFDKTRLLPAPFQSQAVSHVTFELSKSRVRSECVSSIVYCVNPSIELCLLTSCCDLWHCFWCREVLPVLMFDGLTILDYSVPSIVMALPTRLVTTTIS